MDYADVTLERGEMKNIMTALDIVSQYYLRETGNTKDGKFLRDAAQKWMLLRKELCDRWVVNYTTAMTAEIHADAERKEGLIGSAHPDFEFVSHADAGFYVENDEVSPQEEPEL